MAIQTEEEVEEAETRAVVVTVTVTVIRSLVEEAEVVVAADEVVVAMVVATDRMPLSNTGSEESRVQKRVS